MKILSFILLLASAAAGYSYTVNGTVFTTNGSVTDANSAEAACTDGDTIVIPPGTFTWGTGNVGLGVYRNIAVMGSGTGQTFIVCDPSCTLNSIFPLTTSGTVGNLTFVGHASGITAPFSTTGANGWRITNINYDAATNNSGAYFCVVAGNYGLIDSCTISLGTADSELIFGRGPTNSWQTPSSMGTQNCVIIENCTFNTKNVGYLTDANANARFVVRFCTINGMMWIDGHGLATNSPARGVRHMEIYDNTWTSSADNWQCLDLRGGSGMVFNNSVPNANPAWLILTEYACQGPYPNFGNVVQTAANYPICDQIGEGQDVYVGGASQGTFQPAGYIQNTGGSSPYYLWNNTLMGANFTITNKGVASQAVTLFQTQENNPSATFTMIGPPGPDIIEEGRDFFTQGGLSGNAAFTGADGVGVGTTAQMYAITPTKTGVGYWVTDQGSWNTTVAPNTSGLLYTWNGTGWVLTYTPYTYPDPVRGPGGWVSANSEYYYVPPTAAPSGTPPPPTGLRVTGS